MLHELSDEKLLSAIDQLAEAGAIWERRVLEHLLEVEHRKLHLRLAIPSLFEFARRKLRASESTAYRWLRVARAARTFPVVLERVGPLTMTTLTLLAPHMTAENHIALMDRAAGKATREVEKMVATINAKPAARDVIRVKTEPGLELKPDLPMAGPQLKLGNAMPVKREALQYKSATRVRVAFDADEALVEKMEALRELLRHRFPEGRLENLVDFALEAALEHVDPKRKDARAEARQQRRVARNATKSKGLEPESSNHIVPAAAGPKASSRYIPAAVRAEANRLAGGHCTFVSQGVRCSARGFLQYDHIRPFGLGGSSTDPLNIQILCGAHNRARAEATFGSYRQPASAGR